ncbi:hypothetical protein PSHT_04001 [Puccinia striiformis]|uniref:Uncharacterized protein n=1 Tax=Puccinia striiformis TaxID=27350 RepID=A0A2S4WE42_9BASI|nr:hypothetical protein PSHT_04001 [Puccinia striiformis]
MNTYLLANNHNHLSDGTVSLQALVERPALQEVPQLWEASTPVCVPFSDSHSKISHGIPRVGSRRLAGGLLTEGTISKTAQMQVPTERPVLQEVAELGDASELEPHSNIPESHLGITSMGKKWPGSPRQRADLYPLSLDTAWSHKMFEEWLKTGCIPGSSSKKDIQSHLGIMCYHKKKPCLKLQMWLSSKQFPSYISKNMEGKKHL